MKWLRRRSKAGDRLYHQKVVAGRKRQLFCAGDVITGCSASLGNRKWMTNFHPASQSIGLGPYIWPLVLMSMQLTTDAVLWSVTCVTDGMRAKAIPKN